jgi:hypothetical protein
MKNTDIAIRRLMRTRGTFFTTDTASIILPVVEGDFFEIRFNNANRTGSTVAAGNDTFLLVEVIE